MPSATEHEFSCQRRRQQVWMPHAIRAVAPAPVARAADWVRAFLFLLPFAADVEDDEATLVAPPWSAFQRQRAPQVSVLPNAQARTHAAAAAASRAVDHPALWPRVPLHNRWPAPRNSKCKRQRARTFVASSDPVGPR